MENKLWLGPSITSGDRKFNVPDSYPLNAAGCGIDEDGKKFIRVKGVRWFTNLDHNKRHEELDLICSYSPDAYPHYDNYDAIEVGRTADIPYDWDGVMGVPITFLDKYCPEQFEIVNANDYRKSINIPIKPHGLIKDKEAKITEIVEREREREREYGLRMREYAYERSVELLSPGADGWHVNGKKKYARIFIKQRSENKV